jgi:hypothetical protein
MAENGRAIPYAVQAVHNMTCTYFNMEVRSCNQGFYEKALIIA